MTMNADFHDAHLRHWEDAEHLFAKERWANADHLYGLAAECGLKRLMLAFGMSLDSGKNKPADKKDQVHADKVWVRYESYRSGHCNGAGFALTASNPFDNWDINQRYFHQKLFDRNIATRHKSGAEEVRKLLRQAVVKGVI